MIRKRVNEHITKNYNIYIDNARYYYPRDPEDITNTCILFILKNTDEFLNQLLTDNKPADKYIKCKTGLDLYLLRTIKINAIHKSSPYQQLMNNPKVITKDEIITNEIDVNEYEKNNPNYCKYPDIIYIINNKLKLTWFQRNVFLLVTGIEDGEWRGLTKLSKEANGLKISTISMAYNKVFKMLQEYILSNYNREDIFN